MRKQMGEIRPIRSEADYEAALREISANFYNEPEPGSLEADRFEALLTSVEAYEVRHFPIDTPTQTESKPVQDEQAGGMLRERAQAALVLLGIENDVTLGQLSLANSTNDPAADRHQLAALALLPDRLEQLTGHDRMLCRHWMCSANHAFGEQTTPLHVLREPEGAERLLDYLESMLVRG